MKLDIDLNKLSLEQLQYVVELAKKSSIDVPEMGHKKEEDSKPFFHRKGSQQLRFEQNIETIKSKLSKHKKGLTLTKLVRVAGFIPGSTTNINLRTVLAKHKEFTLVNKKWYVQSILDKPDFRVDRSRFVGSRASQLMKCDVGMSREKAFSIASKEWDVKRKSVSVESSKFNWQELFSDNGEKIRQLYYQRFRQNKSVSYFDFNFLGYDNEALYQLHMIKLLKDKENVLLDLGLKGDLSYNNGTMLFKGTTL